VVQQLPAGHIAAWTREDLAKNKITQPQADAIFNELNTPAEQRLPDTRTPDEVQLDKAFPKAKESDYTIRYGIAGGQEPEMTQELRDFDQSARTWMASAGMPREIGNSLVHAIARVAETTKRMTEGELEAYGHKEFEKLQRVHGEKLEERLQAAGRMVHDLDLKTPGLKNLLKSKGIGDTALIANLLMQQAQIFHARNKAQGR
jgi:hypothetical protein